MKRHEKLSILFTFIVGMFFGGYLYLTNVAGLVSKLTTPDEATVSEFVIEADEYGGCRDACPSFQIQADGTFRYLYTPAAGAESVLRKGKLPAALEQKLRKAVTVAALKKQSEVIEPAFCNSYGDGTDIVYKITIDQEDYSLDSCGTAIENDSELWTTLGSVWDYFETGNNS